MAHLRCRRNSGNSLSSSLAICLLCSKPDQLVGSESCHDAVHDVMLPFLLTVSHTSAARYTCGVGHSFLVERRCVSLACRASATLFAATTSVRSTMICGTGLSTLVCHVRSDHDDSLHDPVFTILWNWHAGSLQEVLDARGNWQNEPRSKNKGCTEVVMPRCANVHRKNPCWSASICTESVHYKLLLSTGPSPPNSE